MVSDTMHHITSDVDRVELVEDVIEVAQRAAEIECVVEHRIVHVVIGLEQRPEVDAVLAALHTGVGKPRSVVAGWIVRATGSPQR